MYDNNNTRILDFLFDALIDKYFEKPYTPAEMAAGPSHANLNTELKKVACGRKVIRREDDLAEIENAISAYAYDIEKGALWHGLYTGFMAAKELFTSAS